ncbi:MAG: efflux RND transporter periplasmic adaptor subunit [Bacteroidales bacterium]|jgi:RND family efflux transporter MFP subunit|nr:efflux RND transporter periplasmic adaptor subunit [Bacteroidales bacterium]
MKLKYTFAILVGISAGIAGCSSTSTNVSADTAMPVTVADVRPGSIEQTISTTGTVVASQSVTLSTEMSGKYKLATNPATGKPFMLGDAVAQGQTIVELEDEAFLNNLGLEAKEISLKRAEQNFQSQKSLYEKGGVTQTELTNAEVSAVNARDSYNAALIQYKQMRVQAPFRGVITALPYYTNSTKVNSGTEVVSLMSYENLLLEVNLPEKQINTVQKNQPVRVMNYTLPNDTLHGYVREISPAISTETRTFVSKLTVKNPKLLLRPGMFVQAEIVLAHKDSTVVISKDVIVSSRGGKAVFVVGTDGTTAEERMVMYGYENKDQVEIISGLNFNDRLVVKGYETLRNRSKVKIIK